MIQEGINEIFRRRPGRYESVDGMRALAVIWIVFFHTIFTWGEMVSASHYDVIVHSSWNWFWTKGYLAINLFFIISGFLIGDLLLREIERTDRLALKSFFIRRFFRLAPAYYLVLLGYVVFWFFDSTEFSLKYLWANFIYVNNWFPFREQPANWSWSLAIEEQFYLLAPGLLILLHRWRKKSGFILVLLILASMGYSYYAAINWGPFRVIYRPAEDLDAYFNFFDRSYGSTLTRASALLMGVACAVIKRKPKAMSFLGSIPGVIALAGLFLIINFAILNPAGLPASGSVSHPITTVLLNPFSALSFASLLMLALAKKSSGNYVDRFLASFGWFPLAQMSYGIYLLHVPVLFFYFKFFPPGLEIRPWPLFGHAIVILLSTTLFALLMSVFVETPMRRFGYKIAKGRPNS